MTSARKLYAARYNARISTGPKSSAGKARVAQNARSHGLNLPALCNPAWSGEIEALGREIAGADAGAERLALARPIAAAQIISRAGAARTPGPLSRGPEQTRCDRTACGHRSLRAARLVAPQVRDPRFRRCVLTS